MVFMALDDSPISCQYYIAIKPLLEELLYFNTAYKVFQQF